MLCTPKAPPPPHSPCGLLPRQVLDHMLTNERRKQYGNLIDQVTSDPARLKAWWAALVQAATPDSAGGLMDMALSTMTPGRLDKAARLGGALWGTDAKVRPMITCIIINMFYGVPRTAGACVACLSRISVRRYQILPCCCPLCYYCTRRCGHIRESDLKISCLVPLHAWHGTLPHSCNAVQLP